MKRLIELPLTENSSILVEAEDLEAGGVGPIARRDEVVRIPFTFEQALNKIRPVAENIITNLHGLRNPPDEVGVEFAFKLSAKADVIIASADTEGNFKVTLTWKREQKSESNQA